MKNYSLFSCILLSVLILGFSSSCSKDEENKACANFPVLGGEITVNGSVQKLSIAQFGATGDTYIFQLASVSSDCNKQNILSFNIDLPTGSKLGGTYQIKSSLGTNVNIATGSFTTQQVSPISQSSFELVSGTVKITELGVKKYTIDVNATDSVGGKVTLLLTHQF